MWLLKISLILVDSLLKVGPGKVMEFSHKKGVWTLIDGLKLHDKHQEHLLCAKHWFKELDDPQGQAAAGYSQAFADTSIGQSLLKLDESQRKRLVCLILR